MFCDISVRSYKPRQLTRVQPPSCPAVDQAAEGAVLGMSQSGQALAATQRQAPAAWLRPAAVETGQKTTRN